MNRIRVFLGMAAVVCRPTPRPGRAAGVIDGWISTPLETALCLKRTCFWGMVPGSGVDIGPASEVFLDFVDLLLTLDFIEAPSPPLMDVSIADLLSGCDSVDRAGLPVSRALDADDVLLSTDVS